MRVWGSSILQQQFVGSLVFNMGFLITSTTAQPGCQFADILELVVVCSRLHYLEKWVKEELVTIITDIMYYMTRIPVFLHVYLPAIQ